MIFGLLAIVIIGIGFLIIFHEFGHFVAAKIFHIKVETFSLGLGPLILRKKFGETVYGVSAIPLGGYVKLLGMETVEEVDPSEESLTYRSQPIWKRVIVIFSGALFNLILPTLLLLIVFGFYGFATTPTKTIDIVLEKTPAARAGLKPGDTIVAIDGKKFSAWSSIREYLRANPGKKIAIKLRRGGNVKFVTLVLKKQKGAGFLGVQPKFINKREGVLTTLKSSIAANYRMILTTVRGYYMLLTGKLGPISKNVSGPVGITAVSIIVLRSGFENFLIFLSLLSVNLGLVNLLPILPLDGGHLFFSGIEAVTRKPVRQEIRQVVSIIGLSLILALFVFVFYKDFLRLWNQGLAGWQNL